MNIRHTLALARTDFRLAAVVLLVRAARRLLDASEARQRAFRPSPVLIPIHIPRGAPVAVRRLDRRGGGQ